MKGKNHQGFERLYEYLQGTTLTELRSSSKRVSTQLNFFLLRKSNTDDSGTAMTKKLKKKTRWQKKKYVETLQAGSGPDGPDPT